MFSHQKSLKFSAIENSIMYVGRLQSSRNGFEKNALYLNWNFLTYIFQGFRCFFKENKIYCNIASSLEYFSKIVEKNIHSIEWRCYPSNYYFT